MARFRCRICGGEGKCNYLPDEHKCPRCGARDVQFALSVGEIPDAIFEQIEKLADGDRDAESDD